MHYKFSILPAHLQEIGSRKITSYHRFVIGPEETPGVFLRLLHEVMNLPPDEEHQSPERGSRHQEASMNHSIYSADRTTHLKIVVLALVAGIVVAGVGISTRNGTSDDMQTPRVP